MIRTLFFEDLSLWACLWQSTLLAALGLLGSFLLRRRPARAYQLLLLATIAAVAVPILATVVKHLELGIFVAETAGRPIGLEDDHFAALGNTPAPVAAVQDEMPTAPAASLAAEASPVMPALPWRTAFLLAWLTTTAILAARLLFAFANGFCVSRRSRPLDDGQMADVLGLGENRLGITGAAQVRVSAVVRSPLIWCWARSPVLLLPDSPKDLDPRIDWEGVLSHELAHWRRWDHLSGLLAELAVCILPWNPLLWLSKRRLVTLSEEACDDWVIATGHVSEDYAESLLDFKPQGQMAFLPGVVHSRTGVAGRVRRILSDACANPRTGVKWAFAASALTLCAGVVIAFAQARPARAQVSSEPEKKPADSLREAAKNGDIQQVKSLTEDGADVNEKDDEGKTALHYAVQHGHMDVIELLIAEGADIQVRNQSRATLLFTAATSGQPEVAKYLIDHGADIMARDLYDYTPLHAAAWGDSQNTGGVAVAKMLIDKGADVNARGRWAEAPLTFAADCGHVGLAELLIERGADLNPACVYGCRPLHHAILHHKDVVQLLLSKGADANAKDTEGATALYWLAAVGDNMDMVRLLLANGADVNARNKAGQTALHVTASDRDRREMTALLIASGADVNHKQDNGETPIDAAMVSDNRDAVALLTSKGAVVPALHLVAYRGDLSELADLLATGAGIDERDGNGRTALHFAASGGHRSVVEFLLARGADVNAKDRFGTGPLHFATFTNKDDVVTYFIDHDADVNLRNEEGDTPLLVAAAQGHEKLIERLVTHDADVCAKANSGWTPLHWWATQGGNTVIAELLFAKGAKIDAKDNEGATPLYLAALMGRRNMAEWLLGRGADVDAKVISSSRNMEGDQREDWTPLHAAAFRGHKELAELLLDRGANVNAKDKQGRTPLARAQERGRFEVVDLFHQRGVKE